MTSRTLKLLTASTAFVAVASIGNAATTTTSATTTIANEDASNFVSASAVISVTGAPALIISSTTGSHVLGVSSSSILRSDSVTATVTLGVGSDTSGTVTIINEGSIINTGAGAAISTTEAQVNGQPAVAITNNGTISGSVVNGTGALTYSATSGTQNGDITSGNTAGTDAVTLTSSTMTGGINLGAGTNNVTISDSTVTGSFTGGAGNDTVTIKDSSTVTGGLTFGAGGTDTLTISNSTVVGNISNGAGSALGITLTNATVSGTIIDTDGAGDALTINGENTFTTRGVITGFETINFDTNTVLNHAINSGSDTNIAAGKTVTMNETVQSGGLLTNNGTLNIAAGKEYQAGTYAGTGTLGFAIASSNTATGMGQLVLSGGSSVAAGTSMTINVASTSGYIASGTQYIIVDGAAGAAGVASLTTESTGVYRFATSVSNTSDVLLTVGRVETDSVVTGGDNQNVANVLDALGANATGELATVQGQIGSQSNAAGVQNVVESLTPSIDGAGIASVNFAVDAGNQISNRLASVRGNGYGVATGDAMANKHMWAQGFGSTVEQDDKDGARGYDANSAGASIGMDTDTLIDGVTTGAAFTYGKSSVDSNASGNASTDIDTYAATVYGSRVMDNGVFVNGQAGFGFNQYDMERTVAGVGQTTGETDGWQGTAKIETGRDYAVGGLTLTPLASLQYTYLDMDSYTETGAGGASLRVNPEAMSTVDAGVGAEASYAIALQNGGTLKPSVHAKYFYRMGDDSMATTSQFVGGGTAFDTNGVEADKSSVNVGAGLVLTTIGGTDLSVNYDADIRSSLTGHTGQLKARWAF